LPRQQIVALPFLPICRKKACAASTPRAAITAYNRSVTDIDMRRNALHPKGTSFGARLLTPYNNLRFALRGLRVHRFGHFH
jgi:hypothetical protein